MAAKSRRWGEVDVELVGGRRRERLGRAGRARLRERLRVSLVAWQGSVEALNLALETLVAPAQEAGASPGLTARPGGARRRSSA